MERPLEIRQRGDEVYIDTPYANQSFIDAIKQRFAGRYTYGRWCVAARHGDEILDLARAHFPAISDLRPDAALPPAFADGTLDVFAHLDLIPRIAPWHAPLLDIFSEWHPERDKLGGLREAAPEAFSALGFFAVYAAEPVPKWRQPEPAKQFWSALLAALPSAVVGTVHEDGTATEQLTRAGLESLWLRVREETLGPVPERAFERWYPPRASAGHWIAALLGCVAGPAFTRHPDATDVVLTRTLPAWPVRMATSSPAYVDVRGVVQSIISWCARPGPDAGEPVAVLLHISGVGLYTKLRALWARLMDAKREIIALPESPSSRLTVRRAEGRNVYHTDWNDQPLPKSGLAHISITHTSASVPQTGQGFVHLAGNDLAGAPDLQLFFRQLDWALTLPLRPEWAGRLWLYGQRVRQPNGKPLIERLPSFGCAGYWVEADELRWTRIAVALTRGQNPEDLVDEDLPITQVGVAQALPVDLVEEAAEEDTDTVDDGDD
jgi:hypothetical protein